MIVTERDHTSGKVNGSGSKLPFVSNARHRYAQSQVETEIAAQSGISQLGTPWPNSLDSI